MNTYINKDKSIKLYNDDCIKIMNELIDKNITVDCVVCDPPYKITSRGNSGNTGGMLKNKKSMQGDIFDYNDCHVSKWMPKIYELLKDTGHCYIMTNHINLLEYLNTAQQCGFKFIKSLIWNKGNKIMGQYYMSQFEYILFFRKGGGKKINNCGTSDILNIPNKKQKDENGKNLHDTEKPIELMKILISNSTQENEIVMDFAFGIGATAIACKELNRQFIGMEIDKKYFDITINRLNE